MQLEWGMLLSFDIFLSYTQARAHTHTEILGVSGTGHYALCVEETPLPSSVQEPGECVTPAGCTKLRAFVLWKCRGSQAYFVLRGEAVGQVVAFCQQVKIHCKVPMFTTTPASALKFWVCVCCAGLCGQRSPAGRGDAASILCTDACSLFCGAYHSTLPSPSLQFHPTLSLPSVFDAIC